MENFELIDNLFQITVLLCARVAAGILAIRHRNRSLLILSLAYACFAMGTIYYVLYLVIIGIWPRGFFTCLCRYCQRRGRNIDFLFLPEPQQQSLRQSPFSTTISARLILFPHCFRSRRARLCISRCPTCGTAACIERGMFR